MAMRIAPAPTMARLRTDATRSAPQMGMKDRLRRFDPPAVLWLDLVSKLALVALLVFAVVRDDLPQFQGKAMAGRALTYPLSTLLVPIVFALVWRSGRRAAYPYGLDITLGLPFLIDTAGNALNLYDTVAWWDDLNHFVNWGILAVGFGFFLLMRPVGKLSTAGLTVGFGAVTAIAWELAEYVTFVRHSPELQTAYTDTLGDLGLGLLGSIVAAVLIGWVLWPRRHATPPA
jgi:hypothetical protein